MTATTYHVVVHCDPTNPWLMRWDAAIHEGSPGRYPLHTIYLSTTRRSAERKARRYIRRLRNDQLTYEFKVSR